MEQNDKNAIRQAEEKLRRLHPNWSADKTRWIALQSVGILPSRR